MCKTSAEVTLAIASFKGSIKKCPDGVARGADGRLSPSEQAIREYIAREGPTKVKSYNGGRNHKQ
jgi:hypothetical protein